MKIALVDDNAVNRGNFIQKISSFPELEICMVAVDGNDFLEKMKNLSADLLPHVVFMDIQMPNLNGIDTIRQAKVMYPSIHFIVLTIFEDDDAIFEAIQAGASGYLLKHESHLTIRDTIQEVYDFGAAVMSPAIARKTLKLLGKSTAGTQVSKEESEMLQHIVNGYEAKRIAEMAGISTLAVKKHIANLYAKLHVNSMANPVMHAQKNK